jgi:hypothetical protein
MFLVLLVTLGLLTSWLISKMDEIKKSIERIETALSIGNLKGSIKEAVLEALEEHDDPYPVPFDAFDEGYDKRLKEWKVRHGR